MFEILPHLFSDYTLRTVAMGAAVLGITSGALGSFAVLRGQSLLGDAISHAALPGIALAFILTGSKMPLILLVGAALAGWVGTLLVMAATNYTRTTYDSALGLMLAVFFGAGMVFMTLIQRHGSASQAGLDAFLFGQAATLVMRDVVTMAGLGAVAMLCLAVFWKEFKLLSFDPAYGNTVGFPIRVLDVILTTLLVIAIVIGLQTVGVVLMSAMVVAPAAAARQWTNRLGVMLGVAMFFGAISGVGGAVISSTTRNLPTGPTIVLCASSLVFISLLFAPQRGLIWNRFRQWHQRRSMQSDAVLIRLLALSREHDDYSYPHHREALEAVNPQGGTISQKLEELRSKGLVIHVDEDTWALTPEGVDRARMLLQQEGGAS